MNDKKIISFPIISIITIMHIITLVLMTYMHGCITWQGHVKGYF